jgi:hypothetical protein
MEPAAGGARKRRTLVMRWRFLCRAGLLAGLVLAAWTLDQRPALAQQWGACFVGRDHAGQPAQVALQVERYGDSFEIFGRIASPTVGQLRFKADGHSGAGRLFSDHEYESGALYINVLDLNETAFVLEVEGYGVFQFERSGCGRFPIPRPHSRGQAPVHMLGRTQHPAGGPNEACDSR